MKDTAIKKELRRKGWSYRQAAPVLGVHYVYLCNFANGIYQSHRLTKKIQRLPNYSDFVAKHPTFFENKRNRKQN